MHLTEDFPISSRLIRKTFRDEQKMNPNSARNIWKLLVRTRPEPEPEPKNPTRFQLCNGIGKGLQNAHFFHMSLFPVQCCIRLI